MLISEFSDRLMSGQVHCQDGVFTVTGKIHTGYRDHQLKYNAAEPQDLRLSISGSALPFPNPEVAYGPTNSGIAPADQYGNFHFKLYRPNSYYKTGDITRGIGQGKILALPHIHMSLTSPTGQKVKAYHIPLKISAPQLRSLTGLPEKMVRSTSRNTPSFYAV
jgi:hypothetical protein